jgi:hypothetical protein
MTIRELILVLQQIPNQDLPVVISGYEGGYNLVTGTKSLSITRNPSPYCGDWDRICPHYTHALDEVHDCSCLFSHALQLITR